MKTRLRKIVAIAAVVALTSLLAAACSGPGGNPAQPAIEDFPALLIGSWQQVGPSGGSVRFEGTLASGIGFRPAASPDVETFTWQWVAPAQIRTDIGRQVEFTVLFEDGGDTLVLASTSAAPADEIIRYTRLR